VPVRPILQLGDPGLRVVCSAVSDPSGEAVRSLASDLRETLRDQRRQTGYGRGLAAPQIGEPLRVVHVEAEGFHTLVNPAITARSEDTMEIWDFCLSYFSIAFPVRRHVEVEVRYKDLAGREQKREAVGHMAELLQHELDHLDGVLAVDRVTDVRRICSFSEWRKRYADDNEQIVAEAVRRLRG
jgi:peptide deformylase